MTRAGQRAFADYLKVLFRAGRETREGRIGEEVGRSTALQAQSDLFLTRVGRATIASEYLRYVRADGGARDLVHTVLK
jgi:hypothetical protein